jgi:hypothetical protein
MENVVQVRQQLISQVKNAYQPTFKFLHPFISFSLHRSADFQRLDREARATLQAIRDKADGITNDLNDAKEESKSILKDIRKVAAEHGVTQQAFYFKETSDAHEVESKTWRKATIIIAVGLFVYAGFTLFLHKWEWLKPTTTYETVQMAISKILIFTVISYMLYLSARNFLTHKHNAIINKHRQNALMTYQTIVEAAADVQNKDLILNHAAACIFSPQCTGYSVDGGTSPPGVSSVVELMSKPLQDKA